MRQVLVPLLGWLALRQLGLEQIAEAVSGSRVGAVDTLLPQDDVAPETIDEMQSVLSKDVVHDSFPDAAEDSVMLNESRGDDLRLQGHVHVYLEGCREDSRDDERVAILV